MYQDLSEYETIFDKHLNKSLMEKSEILNENKEAANE